MELGVLKNVDSQGAHWGEPGRLHVEAARGVQVGRRRRVEVADHRLVAGERLVIIAMGERPGAFPARIRPLRAYVEIYSHSLPGSRRRVVEWPDRLTPCSVGTCR